MSCRSGEDEARRHGLRSVVSSSVEPATDQSSESSGLVPVNIPPGDGAQPRGAELPPAPESEVPPARPLVAQDVTRAGSDGGIRPQRMPSPGVRWSGVSMFGGAARACSGPFQKR